METLRTRLTAMVGQSKLAEAINYALNHWDGLTLFLSDGRVEVDSNTVERSMRAIAMGRRNSLFSGSEGGAESWAILASLVNPAKLHDLDPQAYLADVLERIVSGQTKSHQVHELLAWNWKAAHARIATTGCAVIISRAARGTASTPYSPPATISACSCDGSGAYCVRCC